MMTYNLTLSFIAFESMAEEQLVEKNKLTDLLQKTGAYHFNVHFVYGIHF